MHEPWTSSIIPRTIHQIWLGESGGPEPPPSFRAASETWRTLNPSWEYRLWGGEEIRALFAEHRPDLLSLYLGYPHWVQRADAARYLLLYVMGGLYADGDIACVAPVDRLVTADLVLAPTEPVGVSNDLMASAPGHPFFKARLDALPGAFHRWNRPWVLPHFRVMCSTASLFLTAGLRADPRPQGLRLLTRGEYGHGPPEEALVRHLEGNSWAGWDTRALLFLERRWKLVVGLGLTAAVIWAMVR